LGITGILAVELFEDHSGQLYVNELAMRPHNSGHFSIEGSETSQFEQHLRAVLDLPLGDTSLRAKHVIMQNLLGRDEDTNLQQRFPAAMQHYPQVKFHDYCKPPRPGRKLGHLTLAGDSPEQILDQLERVRSYLIDESEF
jgi:5-(carboxyamino)imidazole ribonucleotide synthase